jgi:hypothetical protein
MFFSPLYPFRRCLRVFLRQILIKSYGLLFLRYVMQIKCSCRFGDLTEGF